MAEPYQFNFTPPTPDYDLEALKRALMMGAEAEQGLLDMQPDIDYAEGLRTLPQAPINPRSGTRGFMPQIARATGQSQGISDLRRLQPQEAELRGHMAESAGQQSLFKLYNERMKEERAAQTAAVEVETLNLDEIRSRKDDIIKDNELKIKQAEEFDRNRDSDEDFARRDDLLSDDETVLVANEKGEEKRLAWSRKLQNWVDPSNPDVPFDNTGWTEVDSDSGGIYGSRGKALGESDLTKLSEAASSVVALDSVVNMYRPEFGQVNDIPTGILNKSIMRMSKEDLTKFMGGSKFKDLDQKAKDAIQWWANWRTTYTLPNRHKWFGGTLTYNEQRAWSEAESMDPGMDPAEIKRRMDHLNYWIRKRQEIDLNIKLNNPYKPNRAAYMESGRISGIPYDEALGRFVVQDKYGIDDSPKGEHQGPQITVVEGVPPEVTANMSQKALNVLAGKSPEWIAEKFPQSALPLTTGATP